MKFTKEQQDFIKNASQHVYVLTGGRGHSKTKELIENLQQELDQYKNNWKELKRLIKEKEQHYLNDECPKEIKYEFLRISNEYTKILDKMKELEEVK